MGTLAELLGGPPARTAGIRGVPGANVDAPLSFKRFEEIDDCRSWVPGWGVYSRLSMSGSSGNGDS